MRGRVGSRTGARARGPLLPQAQRGAPPAVARIWQRPRPMRVQGRSVRKGHSIPPGSRRLRHAIQPKPGHRPAQWQPTRPPSPAFGGGASDFEPGKWNRGPRYLIFSAVEQVSSLPVRSTCPLRSLELMLCYIITFPDPILPSRRNLTSVVEAVNHAYLAFPLRFEAPLKHHWIPRHLDAFAGQHLHGARRSARHMEEATRRV